MKTRMKVAVACYAANGIIGFVMAARYWMAESFMPYHALASGTAWESLAPGVQFIVLGLLKVAASGFFAIGIVSLMAIPPVARGENWARWIALAAGLALLLPLLYLTVSGRIATGASYPVLPTATAVVLTLVAFLASRPLGLSAAERTGDHLRPAPPMV